LRAVAIAAAAALAVAGCAVAPPDDGRVQLPDIAKFSEHVPGVTLPPGWQPWAFAGLKKPTEYQLVDDAGRTVVRAISHASASGLVYPIRVDTRDFPYLHWQWKVQGLIDGADNTRPQTEDSPARVIVAFDGDTSKLPFGEKLFFQQFKLFTKTELPYATMMYIWARQQPVGTVIPSAHTSRIKMVVAESGPDRTGGWHEIVRNVREDYKQAFGEEPPPIKSIAIMTDSDNTGESAHAYYGDIAFLRSPGERRPP
jgi:hypothetical protein